MQKIGTLFGKIISWAVVLVLIVFTVYPVIYALLGSLKTNAELTLGNSILPAVPQWQNYYTAFIKSNFLEYGKNSLIVSLATMALAVITTSLSGYILARFDFAGKKLMTVSYAAMMFVSIGAVALYPIMQMLDKIGMSKSMLSLVLVLTGGQITNVFLVQGFVKGVPKELDEAARIDGCSIFRTWWQIIMPLIRPILGVVALFTFRNTWNDYITTLVMTMSNS
jgi:ABC-type glycerol-3-phosphate transport system permease component